MPEERIKQLQQCQEAIEAIPDQLAADLRKHAGDLKMALCRGELGEAQQLWQRHFETQLAERSAVLRNEMTEWEKDNKVREESLKPAKRQLARVDQYLSKTSVPYDAAWHSLIEAQMVFDAEWAEDVADVTKAVIAAVEAAKNAGMVEPKELSRGVLKLMDISERDPISPLTLLENNSINAMLLRVVGERKKPAVQIDITDPEPYTWADIDATGKATCKLHVQLQGFSPESQPTLKLDSTQCHPDTPYFFEEESKLWKGEVTISLQKKDWNGDQKTYSLVAEQGAKTSNPITISIRSPYTIELPLQRLVAGEWFFYQAIHIDSSKSLKALDFEWCINGNPGDGKRPTGRYRMPLDSTVGGQVEILLSVYSLNQDGSRRLVQKARRLAGPIQEPAIKSLYRDKRRANFSRRMAALLIALVGGLLAQRAFSLTFGAFEEYLAAFAWGVAVSAGLDPVANGLSWVATEVKTLPDRKKEASENTAGQ